MKYYEESPVYITKEKSVLTNKYFSFPLYTYAISEIDVS